jgi:hypothetical protein
VSPRYVALEPGGAPRVPASWRRVSFAGLSFAVPSTWPIERTAAAEGFGDPCSALGDWTGTPEVTLDTDTFIPVYHSPVEGMGVRTPSDRVGIDAGPNAPSPGPVRSCRRTTGLEVCVATSPPYSVLALAVGVPGRTRPVIVSIGLAGDGMVARTILYSLRP